MLVGADDLMSINNDNIAIFALNSGRSFGEQVCAQLGFNLSAHEEREFEDGEHKARALVNVRGQDVYVVQSLYADAQLSVNDKLCRLLFFLGALRDASAARVTAVVPYLCYARKDRKNKARDPVTTRYVATLFEAVGVSHFVTLDVHNLAAYQNAFRMPTDHLEARQLFVAHFAALVGQEAVVVVAPDAGGVKRAEEFRQSLGHALKREVASAFMEKHRSAGVVSGRQLVGDVQDKTAIIIDDLISSGGTLTRTAEACQARGARRVFAAASHGVFVSAANQALANPALEKVVVTNTLPPWRLTPELARDKLIVLDIAPLCAQAIHRMHTGGSLAELNEGG
jgi:ribose-phosphate pyrophosphokinase